MGFANKEKPFFTWGCSDELTFRLKKTLYCGEEDDCYDTSSAALTGAAVSMLRESVRNPRRKLSQRYASSLTRQLSISPCAIMMSILYSERLRQLDPCYLDRISSSDLYVVSMLVATKFLHDEGEQEEIYNDEWAEAAGLAISTINRLEREFLDAMDWNIYVDSDEFLAFCSKIETRIAFEYGLKRGWFSYTDLTQFLLAIQYQNVLKETLEKTVKVIGGCALVYGMSLSFILSAVITYAATNHLHSPNTRLVSNVSTSISQTTWLSSRNPYILNDNYSERSITRRRQREKPRESPQKDKKEGVLEDELSEGALNCFNNTQAADYNGIQNPTTTTKCTPSLQSESRFQYKMRQTRISISLDLKDLKRTFPSNMDWNMLQNDLCQHDTSQQTRLTKNPHKPPFGQFFHHRSNNFFTETRLLGMPVI